MTVVSDEELARQAQAGDHDAFATLVAGHQRKVYGLALHLLRDPDDAADAAQEAFTRCYAALPSFNGEHNFGAWLYRIAYNYCLDVLRRRRYVPLNSSRADTDGVLADAADPGPGVEELAERHISVESLERALEHLQDEHRHVLVLRYTLDLPYTQIADILQVPESTVTMRIHHAKRALRRTLAQMEDDCGAP